MPKKKLLWWQKTILLFGLWLIAINVFAVVANNRVNLTPDTAYGWMWPDDLPVLRVNNLIDLHNRWDSKWYLELAEDGYVYNGPDKLSNIVFFPLYPGMIWILSPLFGLPLAGWLISLTALLGVLLLLHKYVATYHPELDPEEVQFLLLTFPTAFFLNAIYTESLFLLLALSSFYFALKRNFVVASMFAMGAALTRVTGVLLFLPILIEYVVAWTKEKRGLKLDVLSLALIPAGTIGFFAFHWLKFGSPTLFFEVQSNWGRGFTVATEHFLRSSPPATTNLYLDIAFIVFTLICSLLIWKKFRLSYAVFTFLGVLVPVITGTLMSIGRYVIVLFPIFFLLAASKNTVFKKIWLLLSILLLALYTLLFVSNYWAG
ncbi:MAG: hypothetical protein WAZ14_04360 [Patescibacteria group bacterium]